MPLQPQRKDRDETARERERREEALRRRGGHSASQPDLKPPGERTDQGTRSPFRQEEDDDDNDE
jgi:hypothetical protein